MELGAITTGAGIVTTFKMDYCPQYLYYVAATQLESIKINVLGDGTITDLDTAGLSTVGTFMVQGRVTNGYIIPLADGFIEKKNLTITITNSAAQTPTIYASSNRKPGKLYVVSQSATALAKTGIKLSNFLSAHFPNAGATDKINIAFRNGLVENDLVRAELPFYRGLMQYVSNSASDYVIGNTNQTVKMIAFIPVAEQVVYTTAFASKGAKFLVNEL